MIQTISYPNNLLHEPHALYKMLHELFMMYLLLKDWEIAGGKRYLLTSLS